MGTSLAFFLVLDASILEPYLDLFLGQVQVGCNLDAPQSGQVHVGGKLALELQELRAGERRAHTLAALELAVAVFCQKIWRKTLLKGFLAMADGSMVLKRAQGFVGWLIVLQSWPYSVVLVIGNCFIMLLKKGFWGWGRGGVKVVHKGRSRVINLSLYCF